MVGAIFYAFGNYGGGRWGWWWGRYLWKSPRRAPSAVPAPVKGKIFLQFLKKDPKIFTFPRQFCYIWTRHILNFKLIFSPLERVFIVDISLLKNGPNIFKSQRFIIKMSKYLFLFVPAKPVLQTLSVKQKISFCSTWLLILYHMMKACYIISFIFQFKSFLSWLHMVQIFNSNLLFFNLNFFTW